MLILALTFAIATIPGITAKDAYPKGCVDCHTGKAGQPAPITTINVDAKLLAKAQASAPKGMTLKGKHPNVAAMVKAAPADCLKCHQKGSKMAPAFAQMMHMIHLTGGDQNPFLTKFDGACTNCHKLDQKTGTWGF